MSVVDMLLTLLFGQSGLGNAVLVALYIAGLWRMLQKSGIKGWWALIPFAREYMLARCALREPEGRVASVVGFLATMNTIVQGFLGAAQASLETALIIVQVPLVIIQFIYEIRIYQGITEVYGAKKRWMILWILPWAEAIPALIWGFSPKWQPRWQVEDYQAELRRVASSGSASVLDEGLTVNLKERSATEFFQKKVLLRDIHMSIPQGHMVLLLGGSGAGKTTYLNAVNGYEKADAQVMLNGSNIYTQYKKMQYEIGFVPQQELMRGKDTVWHTLIDAALLRLPSDIASADRKRRVEEVMEIFGLTPLASTLVEKLSGGQKKRLSIAMEFLSNPSLFILDEPDSGLDGVMARELMEQLRRIADTGKIVIVITHTPDRVIDLFDDVIVQAKDHAHTGRLAFYGSIQEARQFFGRERMEQIVKSINSKLEGGDGLADEFIARYAEVQHG